MLTNRETNAAIKRELKAAGYNTKSFKVSVKDCGYSTSAHVTIKDPRSGAGTLNLIDN